MNGRKRILGISIVAIAAGALFWWIYSDPTVAGVSLKDEPIRVWGYVGKPGNPILAWGGEKLRASDNRRRSGHGGNSLKFDGVSMCWGYSSPTSTWFHFGNNLWGQSNFPYFQFALPTTTGVAAGIAQLPELEFHGNDSNYWAARVGPRNVGFQSNSVGQGAIRLPTGSVLFVRNVENPETVHLLSLNSIEKGMWGNINVRFQRGVTTQQPHRAP